MSAAAPQSINADSSKPASPIEPQKQDGAEVLVEVVESHLGNSPFYRLPEVYDRLRAPYPAMQRAASAAIARWLDGACHRVLDPACGPGNWLWPFAQQGLHVAGNDLVAEMIDYARRRFASLPGSHEFVVGDMCDLQLQSGPFDVALDIAGTCNHLPDDEHLIRHFRSVAAHLRPGGVFLVSIFLDNGASLDLPQELYERPFTPLEQGEASIRYDLLARWPGFERIRRTISLRGGPEGNRQLAEEYDSRVFTSAEITACIDRSACFDLCAWIELPDEDADDGSFLVLDPSVEYGVITLVLRRR